MPRGTKPLRTLTPLIRRIGLVQVGRKRQAEAEAAGKPVKPALTIVRHRDTGPDRLTVEAILERAHHSCERCSGGLGLVRGRGFHVHHRRPRAVGGSRAADTNSPSNCVILCPDCHTAVESRRAEAQFDGWLVPQGAAPARVAVLIEHGGRWVYLTADGRYSLHPPDRGNDNGSEG
jgi:hypothetical protein